MYKLKKRGKINENHCNFSVRTCIFNQLTCDCKSSILVPKLSLLIVCVVGLSSAPATVAALATATDCC